MTRIFTDGAEMGDARFWDWISSSAGVYATQWPAPIGGEWSYRGAWQGAFRIIPELSDFYIRYRFMTDNTIQAVGCQCFAYRHDVEPLISLTLDALSRFCIGVGGAGIYVSSDVVMQPWVWYLIEMHVSIDNVAGRVEVYIDGENEIDYTGDTQYLGYTTANNVYYGAGAYTDLWVDDLALNDTTGLEDNSWCGDGIITKMYPNGMGDIGWHGSDGDDVNNHLLVDEFPNDGDLTYVYRDGTDSGTQEHYTLTDLDYTNKTVLRVYPEARARKTSPVGGEQLKLGILPSGGVDDVSAARILYSDYYARIVGNEYKVNPLDSSDWDEPALDALEMIIEVA